MSSRNNPARVAIVMGSKSDWATMQFAAEIFEILDVPHHVEVVSAHRTPDLLFDYAAMAGERGLKAIIAGAGGAAHAGDDFVELGLDGRAERGHGRDDHDGDQGGDQAVLDGGGARLVGHELGNELGHVCSLSKNV